MNEEIMATAREVSERTGVSVDLLKHTTPENMENLASAVIQYAESQQPKVHAAPAARRSRIVRGDEHIQTPGEKFEEFVKNSMRWA